MTADQYWNLKKNITESPQFIYPVKRDGGHFMLFGQMQDNIMVKTELILAYDLSR